MEPSIPTSPTGARPYAPSGRDEGAGKDNLKSLQRLDYARNHHASSYRSNCISHNPARLDLAS